MSSFVPSFVPSSASHVLPSPPLAPLSHEDEKRRRRARFFADLRGLLSRYDDGKDKPLLKAGIAFLEAKSTRAVRHADLLDSLKWLLERVEERRCICGHAVEDEILYDCNGCSGGLCLYCEVEVNDWGSGKCLSCFFKKERERR